MRHMERFNNDWCRNDCPCGKQRGSASRMQMRAYAIAVAIAMHGKPVCHCGETISITNGEVDRTDEGMCYRPGTVVMTCYSCNNDRTTVKGFDNESFKRDVWNASANVVVPTKADAERIYKMPRDKGETVRNSMYYRG